MNIEQVREFCLSFTGVTEDQPFGDDIITFRIGGKIFLCLWLGDDTQSLRDCQPRFSLKLLPERNEQLREQTRHITPAWHWNKKHWSDVYYEQIDEQMVRELICESYRLVFSCLPKTFRIQYAIGTEG
ncbi:MAG: MmcQ/YjbR family DNA-binding protein [Bacteroidaceae bacterium]